MNDKSLDRLKEQRLASGKNIVYNKCPVFGK